GIRLVERIGNSGRFVRRWLVFQWLIVQSLAASGCEIGRWRAGGRLVCLARCIERGWGAWLGEWLGELRLALRRGLGQRELNVVARQSLVERLGIQIRG